MLGKPMVLLPVFWDQYDNAQRMRERASASGSTPTDTIPMSCRPRSSGCWPTRRWGHG